MLKSKSKREQAGPQWELLGTSPEEMTDLGEKLRRSKKRPDQTLANAVCPFALRNTLDTGFALTKDSHWS